MRAFDQKFKCTHYLNILNTRVNPRCPSIDERIAWCYKNIPDDRLWDYDISFAKDWSKTKNAITTKEICDLRMLFEDETDAMAFKLVWL